MSNRPNNGSPPSTRSASTIMPAHVPKIGMPAAARSRTGSTRPAGARELGHRGGLAAGDHQAVDAGELLGRPHLDGRRAGVGEHAHVFAEVSLEREHAGLHEEARPYQPRVWSRPSSPISLMSRPGIASPRPRETLASTSGSLKCVVASTIARARGAGSSDL